MFALIPRDQFPQDLTFFQGVAMVIDGSKKGIYRGGLSSFCLRGLPMHFKRHLVSHFA